MLYRTGLAFWFSGNTVVATEEYEGMVEFGKIIGGEYRGNFFIGFEGGVGFDKSDSIEDSVDMGIYTQVGCVVGNS